MQSAQLESLEQLSAIIESHRPIVYLLTFVLCAIFSYAMLISYRRAKAEKWMKYFGVASGILTVQYLVLLVSWYAGEHTKPQPVRYDAYTAVTFLLQLLSTANNVWFLAAARELKNKKPAFPRWSWLLAGGALLTTVAGNLFMIQDHWLSVFVARSLDSAFSALCLVLLGHAIYFNISFRIRKRSAFLASFAATIYAFVHIAYWFSPIVARFLSSKESFRTELMSFDLLLIAISLPLKISIFIPAYLLLLRFVETLLDLAKLQDKVVDSRQDYLSSNGVVQLIGEKVGGDVDLVILLPGERNLRVASIPWPNKDPEKRVQVLNWAVGDPMIYQSLLGSKELTKPASNDGPFVVFEPIEAHGTAIGCLKVSRKDYPFSQMAVRQIRAIANLVSPAVQSYRELAALDLLSIRFAEEQSEENTVSPKDAAQMIAEILHDAFSPVVTRLHLDFGFEAIEPIYLGDGGVANAMKEHIDWTEWSHVPLDFTYQDRKELKLFKKKLTAKSKDTTAITRPEDDRSSIGNMAFAVTKSADDRGHPSLGTTYLHRKTAATLAADAYLDFSRDYFSSLLKKFGVKLSRRTMSVEEWFEPVGEIAEAAGFSWVVADGSLKKRLGESDYVLLDRILEELRDPHESCIIHDENGLNIKVYPLSNPLANARSVIELNLPSSEKSICLGVERSGFKEELSFASPWKNFLLDFAKMAYAALTRVKYAIELQRKQIEAAHYQGLATATATSDTIIHQLSNLAHGQSASTSALLDALAVGNLTATEEIQDLLYSIKRSSDRMKTFLSAITDFARKDERRPSELLEAVRQACNFFEASLLQRKIELHIAVAKDTMLDVPFSIATLAIANLIGNAKDAMLRGGKIRIEAETNGDMVLCRVSDEGRGIPTHIRDKIFDIGFSTKNGEGAGWGLYLTKRSLQENRSKIELTETNDKGSAFTIHFPRPNKRDHEQHRKDS